MEPSPRPHRWQEFVGERRQREVVRRRVPGSHAEIGEGDRGRCGVSADQEVRGLDAPVNDAARVCGAEESAHVREQFHATAYGGVRPFAVAIDRRPPNVLAGKIRLLFAGSFRCRASSLHTDGRAR